MFARFQAKLSNRFDRPKTAPPLASQRSSVVAEPAVDERERSRRRVVSLQLTCAAVDSQDSPGIISVRDYNAPISASAARQQSDSAALMSTADMLGHNSVALRPSQASLTSYAATFTAVPTPPAEQRWSNISRTAPQPVRSLNTEQPNALGLYEPVQARTPPTYSFSPDVDARPGELGVPLAVTQSATTTRMAADSSPTAPAFISTSPTNGNFAVSRSRLKRMRSITPVPERPLLHPYTAAAPSTKSGGGTLFDDNQGLDRHVKFRAGTKEEDGVPRTKAARRARTSREMISMERALADEDAMPTQIAPHVPVRPATSIRSQPQSRLAAPPSNVRLVTTPPSRPHSVDIGGQALSAYGIHAREADRAPFVPAKFIPRGYAPERGWTPGARAQAAPMARYSETDTDWQQKEARMVVHIVSDVHGAETLHDWMAGARYAYTAGVPVSGRT